MLLRTMTTDQKFGSIILLTAFGVYIAYQINFLIDPWSSWVHIETPYYDPTLRHTVTANSWASYYDVIFAEPIRLRPVMQALELLDSYLRPTMVATFGFVPSLANATSVLYFAACPVFAILVARRLVGSSALQTTFVVLAVGSFLTSVGYVSASIFIFHPGKKLVIAGSLFTMILILRYIYAPRQRDMIAIGALQFIMALTDEVGLASGTLLCALVASYVGAIRRESISHLGWLVGFGIATLAAYFYRFGTNWTALEGSHIYGGEGIIHRMLGSFFGPNTNFDALAGHAAGAFSSFYGLQVTKYLFLFGLSGVGVIGFIGLLQPLRKRFFTSPVSSTQSGLFEASFLLAAAIVLLILHVLVAVLLLQFGGGLYLSIFNYYYASGLPVFSFFAVCSALHLTAFAVEAPSSLLKFAGWSVRVTLGVALTLALAANVVNMPRLNRLVAMIHNNPYIYSAINEAGSESLRRAAVGSPSTGEVIRIPTCDETTFTRQFVKLLDQMGTSGDIRETYLNFPSRPFVGEKYLVSVFEMMLRRTPAIEVVRGTAKQC